MDAFTRIASVAVAALLAVAVTACAGGGGGNGSATTNGVAGAQTSQHLSQGQRKQQVRQAWQRFFSAKTSASQKEQLLQNGSQFHAALQQMASSPLAGKASAKVSQVTLVGSNKAKVVYTIMLSGKPALKHQQGTAVRENGSWKVGDKSFCSLVSLQGTPPKACSQS